MTAPIKCEPMREGKNGWSEWIHPLPGFLLQCCGCDLIHQMEVAIVPKKPGTFPLNEGEGRRVVVFRMSHSIPASCDTHPKDGDSTEIEAPLVSGAVPSEASADAPPPPGGLNA